MDKTKMRAEYSALSKLFTFLLGKPCPVCQAKDGLGYTQNDARKQTIYIAYEHKIMEGLSFSEKIAFRMGVGAHELCHRFFTNFDYTKRVLDSVPAEQKQLLMEYINILEDPAIEYFASTKFGGKLLKSLRFSIKWIYDKSPKLDEDPTSTPLSEYMSALIMFGDMGLIKGKFTHPEAKKAFYETAQKFYDATKEPNGRKRIDIAKEIFLETKNLWESYCDNIKAMQELAEMLENMGAGSTSGSGSGSSPSEKPEETSTDRTKAKTIRKMKASSLSDEENESTNKASKGSADNSSKDGKDKTSSGTEESEDDKDNSASKDKSNSTSEDDCDYDKNGTGKSSEKENDDDKSEDDSDGAKSEKDDASKESDEETSKDKINSSFLKKEQGSNERSACSDGDDDSEDGSPAIGSCGDGYLEDTTEEWTEYVLTNEDVDQILTELEREVEELEHNEVNDAFDEAPLADMGNIHGAGRCLNQRIKNEVDAEKYDDIVRRMGPQIKRTTKMLQDIFAADKERVVKTNSGKLNVKSIYNANGLITRKGKITENIFLKKVRPEEKSDMAIAIAVDESGSMGCGAGGGKSRAEVARECAIAFAEIFNNLNIPIYIMGFEADDGGYDTVHNHYVTWKNSKKDRLSLMNIRHRRDNRDGVSIRYLTKILKKKPAKNKLLIVLSDGAPAAINYENGDADTASAVREASSLFPVLGVSIGNASQETLAGFYKQNFIVVNKNDDLFLQVAKKLRKMLK